MIEISEIKKIIKLHYLDEDFEVEKIKDGRGGINYTYIVTTNENKFILQHLNTNVISEEMTKDYLNYKKTCDENNVNIPKLILSKYQNMYVKDENEYVFRMFNFIDNDGRPTKNISLMSDLGENLAKIHKAFTKLENPTLTTIENFWDYKYYYNRLKELVQEDPKTYKEISKEIDIVLNEMPKYFLSEDLEKTYIHGDPKTDNFLFKNNEVVAVIDFDTLLHMSVYMDIGDALRSWCRDDDFGFNHNFCKVAIDGYKKIDESIDENLCVNSMRLVTLMLSARFLIDYFEQSYWAYDEDWGYDSKRDYLIFRGRNYLKLFNNSFQDL